MRRAIHFNDKPRIQANEVCYEASDRNLAAKFETKELSVPEMLPELLFRCGL